MATTVNLVPGREHALAAQKRRRVLTAVAVVIALMTLVIWLIIFAVNSSALAAQKEAEDHLDSVKNEIEKLAEAARRVELFENRLASLNSLLDTHIQWDPLLLEIERLLPPPIQITDLEVKSEDGTLLLGGIAPDLDQLAQGLASLENSDNHSTLLSQARLETSFRETQTGENNEVVGQHYVFRVEYKFNPDVVRGGGGGPL